MQCLEVSAKRSKIPDEPPEIQSFEEEELKPLIPWLPHPLTFESMHK